MWTPTASALTVVFAVGQAVTMPSRVQTAVAPDGIETGPITALVEPVAPSLGTTAPAAVMVGAVTVGGVVSMVTASAAVPLETPPIDCVAVIDQPPSGLSTGRSHAPALEVAGETAAGAVNEHVTEGDPDFAAVTVTVAPGARFDTVIVGVLSEVMRSVAEDPVSDVLARASTGSPTSDQSKTAGAETFPALSVRTNVMVCAPDSIVVAGHVKFVAVSDTRAPPSKRHVPVCMFVSEKVPRIE